MKRTMVKKMLKKLIKIMVKRNSKKKSSPQRKKLKIKAMKEPSIESIVVKILRTIVLI